MLFCAPPTDRIEVTVPIQIGGTARGYQAIFIPSSALASPGYDGHPAVYLYIAVTLGKRAHLPPTGSSGLPWRWRFRPQVHAGRVRHPDGQTDRRPRRRGRAVGTPARTIRMPPVSRSGSRAADGHQPRIIQRARTRQARARECRGGTGCRSPGRQGAGRCGRPDRPSSYSGITLSDEGGLKRTHADPPIWAV